jgi:ribosomal protein L11
MTCDDLLCRSSLTNHFFQALGPLGINMMEFCKAFNAATDSVWPIAAYADIE